MRYLFEPEPGVSMAREIGELVSQDGDTIMLLWNGQEYTRNRMTDFVREVME